MTAAVVEAVLWNTLVLGGTTVAQLQSEGQI